LLSKTFPEKLSENVAAELRKKLLSTIQDLFTDDKAKVSLMRIAGAVDGLRNHLINFAPNEDDTEFNDVLYECMRQLSDPEKIPNQQVSSASNKTAFKNMLHIVHQHGSLVKLLLFRDYQFWHRTLKKWLALKSYDDRAPAILAMQTFHQQVASVLEQRQQPDDKKILLFFMNFFKDTLKSPASQTHEVRIAIRGFGAMAAACKLLAEPKYLSELFDLVMQRTESSYDTRDRLKRREVLEHLPNYVESLSKIMNQLDEISGIQLQSLQTIIVILIKDFHYLSSSHHAIVANALIESFLNLQKLGGKVLDNVLEAVIWQGILWTCSHQLVYDMKENLENVKDWKETITYQRYLPLWRQLLTSSNKEMSKLLYSFFIKDLFLIIDKLDLSTRKRRFNDDNSDADREFFFSDPSLSLEPVRAENFQILYNLVQFYSDTIKSQSKECLRDNFAEWLELWIEKVIQLSMKHPLVSGFLQLLEVALRVINQLELNNEKIVDPLSNFVKSILMMRCHQMSGELQVACLQVVFQVPTVILKAFISELIPIFIVGFLSKCFRALKHISPVVIPRRK